MEIDQDIGDKYYCLLQGDKLKLFSSQENAYGYFNLMKKDVYGLKHVLTIYRNYSENHEINHDYEAQTFTIKI
jgi:hypothetical protein